MPDLKQIQNDLQQARNDKKAAQDTHFAASETLKRVERERARLEQTVGPNNGAYLHRKSQLDEISATLKRTIESSQADLQKHLAVEGHLWEILLPFSDPREQLKNLPDDTPFLLFPVRLETRFKKVTQRGGGEKDQLWVRVYPDDCAIDQFEEVLSESELRSARIFWEQWWKAGGHESQQRGAWAGLVSAHGSGRAAWITGKSVLQPGADGDPNALQKIYRPLNAEPVKASAHDIILVATIETDDAATLPFTTQEETLLKTYWASFWLADGDPVAEQAARTALETDTSAARADALLEMYVPSNLKDVPKNGLPKSSVAVKVETLLLPRTDTMATRSQAWSRAPQVNVMPERFILLGYQDDDIVLNEISAPIPSPLVAGPNPSAPKPENGQPEDAFDAVLHPEIRWMTDFEEAVRIGMGFKADLSAAQAERGFDRLIVVGLRVGSDAQGGRELLEQLLQHHQYSSKGFGLLPQGAATNNTDKVNAAFTRADDPDESFDLYFKPAAPAPLPGTDPILDKRDGEWLCDRLGLNSGTFTQTLYADGADQSEARAMNIALWPVTLGYLMDSMMQEVFSAQDVERTRQFFTRYVSGRGPIPALRIGRQPYGILPACDFDNMAWFKGERRAAVSQWVGYLEQLHGVLSKLSGHWNAMKNRADWVGKTRNIDGSPADAHQTLLNIVGLHPASVEFYQRHTPGRDFWWNFLLISGFYNRADFLGRGIPETPDMAEGLDNDGMNYLRFLGYNGEEKPGILDKIFMRYAPRLQGPLIDDVPLSETDLIRAYTAPVAPDTTGKNYIQWLIEHAQSPEVLRKQEGFIDNKPPTALLYMMLHQALIEGYFDAGLRAHVELGLADVQTARAARIDRPFIHVEQAVKTNTAEAVSTIRESKYEWLYTPVSAADNQVMFEHLAGKVFTNFQPVRYLSEQLKALPYLKDAPTARLERVFAEHIDTCSYRLDAWKTGLMHLQMEMMQPASDDAESGHGMYLGAFGWLENVRPENKVLTSPQIPQELQTEFQNPQEPPLMSDSTNAGYILAPSLNHAVAASVLRNGYLSNATPANPQTLAVNLSSERVRKALGVLEGIRNGQPLGALLGYHLERGLHDRYDDATGFTVDEVIYDLRLAFPLYGGQLATSEEDDPQESVEANNVINGLDLVTVIKENPANKTYPFGKSTLPNTLSSAQVAAINEEVDRMLDLHDAIADLVMAESVYQVTLGNYDRAASTLDAFSKAGFPPEPQIVQTPRTGVALTHRVGLHLNAAAVAPAGAAPRALLEPALNEWLGGRLPAMNTIGCAVYYADTATANDNERVFVTAQDLGLQPIDLLYLLQQSMFTPSTDLQAKTESTSETASKRAFSEMDDLIEHFIRKRPTARPDREIRIAYTEIGSGGQVSCFEIAALVKSLRALVLASRALRPADLMLPESASDKDDVQASLAPGRVTALQTIIDVTLDGLKTDFFNLAAPLRNLRTLESNISTLEKRIAQPEPGDDVPTMTLQLQALQAQVPVDKQSITDNSDTLTAQIIPLLLSVGKHGFADSGIGNIYAERQRIISVLRQKASDYHTHWQGKLTDYDAAIAEFDAVKLDGTVPESQKVELLRKAERLVSTAIATGNTMAEVEGPVKAARAPFVGKLAGLQAFLAAVPVSPLEQKNALETFRAGIEVFDTILLDIQTETTWIYTFAEELLTRADLLSKHLDVAVENSPLNKLKAAFDKIAGTADAQQQVQFAIETAQLLLGEDFRMIPVYATGSALQATWQNAHAASASLLDFQKNTLGNDFPEDDWLHGVARVREKMWHWENLTLLSEGLGLNEPALTPLQFPLEPDDRWLALQYREENDAFATPEHDHLLYTPHYGVAVPDISSVCGLLLDEWTEMIPQKEETIGVGFHYDRPNTEPPQTWLMVLPTDFRGGWTWNDVTGALLHTLDEAKRRAVEPAFIDDTSLARFLPATMAAVTTYPITLQMNYAVNNQYFQLVNLENNG